MMGRFGFGERWRWIKECISSCSFFALMNGSPSRFFKASRGLRQGDPLSPFLFTMVAKAISALLLKAKDIELIGDFEVERGSEATAHLQFVDDTILRLFQMGGDSSVKKKF